VDPTRLDDVRCGSSHIPNIEYWLGFDVRPLIGQGLIETASNQERLLEPDVLVHLVCVPTERDTRPDYTALRSVLRALCPHARRGLRPPPLVIIESTLGPHVLDDLVIPDLEELGIEVGHDLLLGVAPRRDWFSEPERSLRTLPRVVGGTNAATTARMVEVLQLVCRDLRPATDHRHAALVKSVENAYRQVEIALANQLCRGFPSIDMVQVLELAGTKWNIGHYTPSFGTGGYCIPLAPLYVLDAADAPQELTILDASVASEEELPRRIARSVVRRYQPQRVAIAGLAYKGDLKVAINSPAIRIASELKGAGVDVAIHDPYFSAAEVEAIAGAPSFRFPEDVGYFDVLLLACDHRAYAATPLDRLQESLGGCKVVIDGTGAWRDLPLGHVAYHRIGDGTLEIAR
jgi:nucleotide sugar dehydrogenase